MNPEHASYPWNPQEMRDLLIRALPEDPSQYGRAPDPRLVYLPPSHIKALRPDAMVVAGMRGAGKSFWWSALQQPQIRALVAKLASEAEVEEQTRVTVGFGERSMPDEYPGRDVLEKLLNAGFDPRLIWRTVIVHKLAGAQQPLRRMKGWHERVRWVSSHPEEVERLLAERDKECERQGFWFLALFDALDRSASNWQDMYRLIRGLLETALDFRTYARLRVKCFLRNDQLDESQVADFPDASKVMAPRVELNWPHRDLYGLLWQYLANANHPSVKAFRDVARERFRVQWFPVQLEGMTVWRLVPGRAYDEELHRHLFHAIAGDWMGRDRRRGFPYTWIPGHLADAHGNTSPRSFLAALRAAADDARQYPGHPTALHYESIKRGVQRASAIRVLELKEDYPWVDWLMDPLRGLVVPCSFTEIAARWEEAKALERIRSEAEVEGQLRASPAHWREGPEGVSRDLEDLGIFFRIRDGRINIPDVYRLGYGLGRRGGVKPVRRGDDT